MTGGRSAALVDTLSTKLVPRLSRRGFFARTALAGTALAVVPVDYILKPGDAYAQVCSCAMGCECGRLCCDGYTEFCCTMTGANKCPSGTVLGGWWKADGTGLCGSGPRYYMDCNAQCGGCGCGPSGICDGSCAGVPCGCTDNDCNNRRTGCSHFRYGQCNNHLACIGPIICRVVTCVPPWNFDTACSTAVLVDQNTSFHDRPCLHRTLGNVESFNDGGGGVRIVGWALDYDTPDPIAIHVYVDGGFAGVYTADRLRGDVAAIHQGMGASHGFDVLVQTSSGSHRVDVYAINPSSSGPASPNVLIGTATVTVTSPFGNLDSVVVVGPGSVRIVGWAIDPDGPPTAPVQVRVTIDNVDIGTFSANRARSDVAGVHSGAGPNHGFDISVALAPGTHVVSVYANNLGAATSNTLLGTRVVDNNRNPFGNIDLVRPVGLAVQTVGWAIDPDTSAPIGVHLYIDGTFRQSISASLLRNDVGTAYSSAGPNHGFDLTVPTAAGTRTVDVYGINAGVGTANSHIGRRVVQVGGAPYGNVEMVMPGPDTVRVVGWAIDPDTSVPVDIHVYADSTGIGIVKANLERADVGAAYPGYGDNHGFDATFAITPGGHSIRVFAINIASGASNTLVATEGVSIGGIPIGSVDQVNASVGSVRIRGWTLDPDSDATIDVHVYVDGVRVGIFAADALRPDVQAQYPPYGVNHGFDVTIPISSGSHTIHVYAINVGFGTSNPLIGFRSIVVP